MSKQIKVYTTATCVYCRAEKEFLKQHGLEFAEVRVDEDPDAAEEMIHLSGQMAVPFTVITDEAGKKTGILGFDQAKLTQVLGI